MEQQATISDVGFVPKW